MAADRLIAPTSGHSSGSCGSESLESSCSQPAENGGNCVDEVPGDEPVVAGEIGGPAVEPGSGGSGRKGGKPPGRQRADDPGEDVAGAGRGEPGPAGGVDGNPPLGFGHDRPAALEQHDSAGPFGQPARTGTQHEDHGFPENEFPFSTTALADPLTGKKGSLFRGDDSDPKLIETNTSTEYWQKGASLLHTDPLGKQDLSLPENSRVYMIAGTQHGGRAGATTDAGPNINPRNPHNPMPAVRALLVALDEWVVSGKEPPPSRVPTLAEGTLVEADKTGFPAVPGAAVVKVTNQVAPPGDWVNPKPADKAYRTLVCKVDADGNEAAGIRLPDIAVPLATYSGWNEYKPPYPKGELADRDGSCLPFPADKTARQASGDPRLSIAERYASGADYVAKVQAVVAALAKDRLLLAEDAEHYLERARREPRVAP